jgi:O-antigen/teichoic acid export membrane protein
MADRLAQVPVSIVANSVRRVFFQKAASISNQGRDLRKAFLLSTGGLALMGFVPFLCVSVYGQELCSILLGARWTEAGRFLEVMAPWLFMLWVESPCHPVFVVLRRQRLWLTLQSILTILRIGVICAGLVVNVEPIELLRLFVLTSVTGNILTILFAYMLIEISRKSTKLDLTQ